MKNLIMPRPHLCKPFIQTAWRRILGEVLTSHRLSLTAPQGLVKPGGFVLFNCAGSKRKITALIDKPTYLPNKVKCWANGSIFQKEYISFTLKKSNNKDISAVNSWEKKKKGNKKHYTIYIYYFYIRFFFLTPIPIFTQSSKNENCGSKTV